MDLFDQSIKGLHGVLFLGYDSPSDSVPLEKPQVLWGEGCYHEEILGTTFRVSSTAFLQGHTEMCEVLYSKVVDLVKDCDVVLDLCCGIGSIGICIKKALQGTQVEVTGIEICAEAVEDAKINDPEYDVILGRVEEEIKTITDRNKGRKIVGILDPPRAGVTKEVILALRRCRGLDRIIYIACSPQSVTDNLLQLTLPVTHKRKAPEFVIKELYGLDLFPQTKHLEALFYLERT